MNSAIQAKSGVSPVSIQVGVANLVSACHGMALAGGWWNNPRTGESLLGKDENGKDKRNVPELLCLIHSEISEAMEGHRKNKDDEHLPQYKSIDVELADAIIRICDLAGSRGVNLGEIIVAKMEYNAQRADHSLQTATLCHQ